MLLFNGNVIHVSHFPNTECRIQDFITEDEALTAKYGVLELRYETDNPHYLVNQDLMNLAFVKDELDKKNISTTLLLMSMPYQRMDRKCGNDLFTLKPTCDYINWLQFKEVVVLEPHSVVTEQLLERVRVLYPVLDWIPGIQKKVRFSKTDTIVFPDKGAMKRYYKKFSHYPLCICHKTRNKVTNQIEDCYIESGEIHEGQKCIIIDDICSKGDTMLACANLIKQKGAAKVYVAVTHCEASIFDGNMLTTNSPIDMVFTSKSNMSIEHPKIKYLDILL